MKREWGPYKLHTSAVLDCACVHSIYLPKKCLVGVSRGIKQKFRIMQEAAFGFSTKNKKMIDPPPVRLLQFRNDENVEWTSLSAGVHFHPAGKGERLGNTFKENKFSEGIVWLNGLIWLQPAIIFVFLFTKNAWE